MGHVEGSNRCRGDTLLRAEWHGGSDSSVVNNPFVEPGHTALFVNLPSVWGSMDGHCIFPPILWEGSLLNWGL
jgi:hypothetical protein